MGKPALDYEHALAMHQAYLTAENGRNRDAAYEAYLKFRSRCDRQLALERGWKVSRHWWPIWRLLGRENDLRSAYGEVDHATCFSLNRRPHAVLSHSYCDAKTIEEFARDNGLNAELLPWSWYYPGWTIAVIFTRREQ